MGGAAGGQERQHDAELEQRGGSEGAWLRAMVRRCAQAA